MIEHTNHDITILGINYAVDFYTTHSGIEITSAIEPFSDGSGRECTPHEINAIKDVLTAEFDEEIEALKGEAEFDMGYENADNRRD